MTDWIVVLPFFMVGLISSAHCIGMCGGIMGALTVAIPSNAKYKRWQILIAYNFGRILSYAIMGLLLALFVNLFSLGGGGEFLRLIAGLLLIAMGLYVADWWRGLIYLERAGKYLWAYVQPLGKYLLPVDNLFKALLLGSLWGWLPCGLVYSALVLAITQSSAWLSAGGMLAFGVGTLPSVLAAGFASQQLIRVLQKRQVRMGLAVLIIVYGVWTIIGGFGHAGHQHSSLRALNEPNHDMMDHSAMHHDHSDMDAETKDAPPASNVPNNSLSGQEAHNHHSH